MSFARALIPSVWRGWSSDPTTPAPSQPIAQAWKLCGTIDANAMRKAVRSLLFKYNTGSRDGEDRPDKDALPVEDFAGRAHTTRDSETQRFINEHAEYLANAEHQPMLHAALARLSPAEHILLLAIHPSLCGAGVLVHTVATELSALYNSQTEEHKHSSHPLVDMLALGLSGCFDYWKDQLEKTAETLRLPSVGASSSRSRGASVRESHPLPRALVHSIGEFSQAEGVNPFITLFAGFSAVLARHSGQREFFVGASASNLGKRAEAALLEIPAILPLRVDLSGDPSFREFVQRIRRVGQQAFAHRRLSFSWLAEQTRKRQNDSGNARLFPAAMVLESPAWQKIQFSGLEVSEYQLDSSSSGLDLVLRVEEVSSGLSLNVEYDSSRFDSGVTQRFLTNYETLLEEAMSDASRSVTRLPILTAPERRKLLQEWNTTARPYPADVPLSQLIEEQVEKTPDAMAIVFAPAGKRDTLTYSELNRRANRLAAHLRSLGVTRNTLVGVCVERSTDLLVAPLAILKAGGGYLPLDPDRPDEHLATIVESAGLTVLIGRPELAARLPSFQGKLVIVDWARLEAYPDTNQPAGVSGQDLAYVIYTSGTTGQPKGVMISRRALNNLLWSVRDWFRFGSSDVLLALTTIAFDIAGVDLWLPLLSGACILMAQRGTSLDAYLLHDIIQREGVTFLQCTPAVWRLLIESGWQGDPRLQAVCTGEAMPAELARALFPRVGRLWNMYGPTETTIWSTGYRFSSASDPVLIGRPIANTQMYILDEHLAPVPAGVEGELYIGGDGLADGYLNNDELTSSRFVRDPFAKAGGARLYKTGDLARYRIDGNIECCGRNDDQIKLRGFRIEPEEIREVILREPSIRDAIAVLETGATGEGRIVAYVVAAEGERPDAIELRNRARQSLPDYMVPSVFIFLDAFPLTGSGKIDRKALSLAKTQRPPKSPGEAPADQIESRLRDLFCAALNLNSIGVNDDFFELGGHSLIAAELFRQVNVAFSLKLPLATLFQAPTVRLLAALIRDSGAERMCAPIVPIEPQGTQPPLYCIGPVDGEVIVFRRLARELGTVRPVYGLQPFGLLVQAPTVERLAAAYIEEIRKKGEPQSFGLVGYSFGGLVAVEMARQLRRKGVVPTAVMLIDTNYPAGCRVRESWAERLERYRYSWDEIVRGRGVSYLVERLKFGFARLMHRASARAGISSAMAYGEVSTLQLLASESYRIRSYDGRVFLFRAETQPDFFTGGPDLGWSGVLSDLVVEDIPGDHGTINTGTNLKVLAQKIRDCL